jgi:predicted helicase
VEVLRRIRRTLATRGLGDLLAERMVAAATTRVVGFEIMPAPFVIAHWQVGEALRGVQAHLRADQRAAIYLTNALTGWDAAEATGSLEAAFAQLERERDEAREVKQRRRILVVLGNPPYNAFAGTGPSEERGLVEPYKQGLSTRWGVKKFNLDDLYVRFFRVAERRIAETTGEGVICFISNFSWLAGASFVVMRQRLLESFDAIWVDNLNGDSRETGKLTPEGLPDPSAFSTPFSKEGIRVGTAIATLVKRRA